MPRLAGGLGRQKFGIGQVVPAKTVTISELVPVLNASVTFTGQTVTVTDTTGGDANVAAWVAAVIAAGGSVSSGRQTLVENLVTCIKVAGVWSKLDRLWLHRAENSQSALIDLVAAASATAVNSPAFTADQGYTGNGSSSYIDSNFNASTAGGHYSRDDASIFGWNNTLGGQGALFGITTGFGVRVLLNLGGAGNTYYALNDGTTSFADAISPVGLYLMSRIGPNSNTLDLNGSQIQSNTSASQALLNGNFRALSDLSAYGNMQEACLGFGGSLSSGERTALNTCLNTYMAGVGTPADTITVTQASVLFTGKAVTIRDTEAVPVLKASVTYTGKTVSIIDREVIPVLKGTVTFAGQAVTIVNLFATQVVPAGKGDILFAGQPIIITDTGVQPPAGLPGGGGFSVPPYIDYGRKKRRRYRALEEIEKRIDERIERLTAESRATQEKIAAGTAETAQTSVPEYFPEYLDALIGQQARITAQLHDAQKRAEKVRQEKIELAQLARIAAEAADEEEAIFALLF